MLGAIAGKLYGCPFGLSDMLEHPPIERAKRPIRGKKHKPALVRHHDSGGPTMNLNGKGFLRRHIGHLPHPDGCARGAIRNVGMGIVPVNFP